jgi:hypothetical protein
MSTPKQQQTKSAAPDTAMTAPQEEGPKDLVPASYADFAGAGFEGQTQEDLTIPFLTVLQANSKPVEARSDLRQGMLYNTVTGEAVDGKEGISFVPTLTQHLFVEWKPRNAGGGFVGIHEVTDPIVVKAKSESKTFGKYNTVGYNEKGEPLGNDLVETFYVWGLSLGKDGDDCMEVVLAFTGSGIKKYKVWNTRARSIQLKLADGRRIQAPLFAHRYRIKTVGEKNAKGSWYNWDLTFDGADAAAARLGTDDMRFQAAVKMKTLIEQGRVKAAHEVRQDDEVEGGGGGAGPVQGDKPVF